MKHLTIAENEIGVKEMDGDQNHPRILEYHATTTLGDWLRSQDRTPWCASFVGFCLEQAGMESTQSALARSYVRWGEKVALEDWLPGDVMVIKAKRKRRGGYHVGFPYGMDKRHVVLLGGNQSDAVQMSVFSRRKWDIVAVRRYCP